jgi:FixJ family two-component response regulator
VKGGAEVVAALRASNPKLPILVVSGYTDGAFAELFSEQPGLRLLAKPFLARELLGAVGEALSPKRA